MSLVLAGQRIEVPGLNTVSWLDDPQRCPKTPRVNRGQASGVRSVVLHTVRGIKGGVARNEDGSLAVSDSDEDAEANARYYARPLPGSPEASAHAFVSSTGTVFQVADFASERTWHACGANAWTVGVELVQRKDGGVYEATFVAAVVFIDWLTRALGIQRQVPARLVDGVRTPSGRVVKRLNQDKGGPAGRDFRGVYGHRNNTDNRGEGDPGDEIFHRLLAAGYEGYDLDASEDLATWQVRQRKLGLEADGVPGPATVAALRTAGNPQGLWVARPGDTA